VSSLFLKNTELTFRQTKIILLLWEDAEIIRGFLEAYAKIFKPTRLAWFASHTVITSLHLQQAAKVIQAAFRRARDDPAYEMCKTRLMREFMDLDRM
jgi:hypothetical protein